MNFAEISSENVRKLLSARGWSLRRLAEEIRLSPSSLSDSLRSRHGLSVDVLCRVAEALGVSVDDLCRPAFDPQQPQPRIVAPKPEPIPSYALLDAHGRAVVDAVLRIEWERMRQGK